MKLESVEIAGYRSTKERLDLPVDPGITILVRPNDQGKTNILDAFTHLNPSASFADADLNWDMEGQDGIFSQVRYVFCLSGEDMQAISQRWDAKAGQQSEEERERIDVPELRDHSRHCRLGFQRGQRVVPRLHRTRTLENWYRPDVRYPAFSKGARREYKCQPL